MKEIQKPEPKQGSWSKVWALGAFYFIYAGSQGWNVFNSVGSIFFAAGVLLVVILYYRPWGGHDPASFERIFRSMGAHTNRTLRRLRLLR